VLRSAVRSRLAPPNKKAAYLLGGFFICAASLGENCDCGSIKLDSAKPKQAPAGVSKKHREAADHQTLKDLIVR
jgi:hypothetical protein